MRPKHEKGFWEKLKAICILRARKGGLAGSVEGKGCAAENAQMVSYDMHQSKGHGETPTGLKFTFYGAISTCC